MRRFLILLSFIIATTLSGSAQLRMPSFFSNGMVVQRGEKIPVWGWATPGSTVEVRLAGNTRRTKVGTDGRWTIQMPKMKAGGPYSLEAKSGDSQISLANVLVGDVFLCSGQSNMELPVRRCMDKVGDKVKSYTNHDIRYMKVPHQYNYVRPNEDMRTSPWQDITPENCGEVSAICYFMARSLQEKYRVPIGIINSSVGGTRVEAWTPRDVLSRFDGYAEELKKSKYNNVNWPDSVRQAENAAGARWEREMAGKDSILQAWSRPDFSFDSWQTIDMFSDWSKGNNGSYWFRTTVDLPESCEGKEAVLRFGAIKDADSIFVNGCFTGNTTYQYPPRVYKVKGGVLKSGTNEIVVHLMSQNGRPGFTNGKLYQMEVDGDVFPLSHTLQMAVGCTMPPKPTSTYFVDGNTGLYNAMIAPLGKLPFRGMLWYQGESNMGNTGNYCEHLSAMVDAWRKQFGREFPVVIVQLPGYMGHHEQPFESGWTQIRHQQYLASSAISHAALVPTLDSGEAVDIHPQDKDVAGHRAALQMMRMVYGEKGVVSNGPTPERCIQKGDRITISFSTASGKLKLKGDKLSCFAVCQEGKFRWVEANITDDHKVELQLPVSKPVTAVRYCWDDFPNPTLYNEEGIPAPQFEVSIKQ